MAPLLGPEQQHGQNWYARWDPCYNAPVTYCCGLLCVVVPAIPAYFYWDQLSTFWDETSVWFWLAVVASVLVLLLGLSNVRAAHSQALRRRMRMGKWPVAEPASLWEIQRLLQSDNPPIAVGEGWVYHLSGQLAPANQSSIALGAYWSGVVEWTEDTVRVRSGTLWGELIEKLWEKHRAPVDRPAYDGITLGASVRVAAHGWTQDGWFIEYVVALQAVERGSGKVAEARRGDSNFWTLAFDDKWVITEVELKTQANRLVKIEMKSQPLSPATTMYDITSYIEAEGLQNWRSSALATMHIEPGKVERKYVTFDPVADEDQMDQTCLGYRLRFLGFGVSGIDSLSDVMTSIRTSWILEVNGWNLSGNIDIELLVVGNFDWEEVALILSEFHRSVSVRTDLRERTRDGITVTGFDAVINPKDLPAWFDVLYEKIGVRSGVIHPGKHIPATAGKIQLGNYGKFWEELVEGRVEYLHDGTRPTSRKDPLQWC